MRMPSSPYLPIPFLLCSSSWKCNVKKPPLPPVQHTGMKGLLDCVKEDEDITEISPLPLEPLLSCPTCWNNSSEYSTSFCVHSIWGGEPLCKRQ